MKGTVRVAFWLLPAEQDAGWLQTRIGKLAARHGGPAFEPHVTLHVGAQSVDLAIEPLLAAQARRAEPLELQCTDTSHSDAYYKALFVRLAADRADGPGLTALRQGLLDALDAAGAPPSDYAFDPHLSLLYGCFAAATRHELAGAEQLPGRRIRFDRLAAVRPAPGSVDLERVADWEIFGHCRLGTAG